jgi:hypothetical protein
MLFAKVSVTTRSSPFPSASTATMSGSVQFGGTNASSASPFAPFHETCLPRRVPVQFVRAVAFLLFLFRLLVRGVSSPSPFTIIF